MEGLFHLNHRACYHIRPVCIIPKPYLPGEILSDSGSDIPKTLVSIMSQTLIGVVLPMQQHLSKNWARALFWQQPTSEVFHQAPRINHFRLTSEKLYLHHILPFGVWVGSCSCNCLWSVRQICGIRPCSWQIVYF